MKYFLSSVILLLMTGTTWSINCRVCDEGTIKNRNSEDEPQPLTKANNLFHYFEDPCKEGTPETPCADTTDDVCVTYTMTYTVQVFYTSEWLNVIMTQYRCGKESEITSEGNHIYCSEFGEAHDDRYYTFNYDYGFPNFQKCEAEITKGGKRASGLKIGTSRQHGLEVKTIASQGEATEKFFGVSQFLLWLHILIN